MLREPGYLPIRPRLLAERLMVEPDGTAPLEHKIFVFDGRAQVVHTVIANRTPAASAAVFDCEWRCLGWRTSRPHYPGELPRPRRLDDILALADRLGVGFDHLRVDIYEWMGQPRVGELTLYNASGLGRFDPDDADFILGSWWQLRNPVRRALGSVLAH
jgi:hypothetical protein